MKDLLLMFAHLLTTLARLLGPGGARATVTDSLLMKQQLLIINRSRRRTPNLTPNCESFKGRLVRTIATHNDALMEHCQLGCSPPSGKCGKAENYQQNARQKEPGSMGCVM